jgi:predicted dehydrogenase
MTLRVGVVGAGLIGSRRAQVIAENAATELAMVADINAARVSTLGADLGCEVTTDWRELVSRPDIDAVVVATFNTFLAPISIAALESGKHVLCEKPLGISLREAQLIAQTAERTGTKLKVGFNLRFHPAIRAAHDVCASGKIGRVLYARAAYGHGGRPGYDQEWRGNAELAGGGELLDQGVHVADLCRWFLGEFDHAAGVATRGFWNTGTLEDNGFALLWAQSGAVAIFHTSWMQWKNRFIWEVIGTMGYATVEGLGGSYGPERLTVGERRHEGGPPVEYSTSFGEADLSWRDEWQEFVDAIRMDRSPMSNGSDAVRTMHLIEAIYEASARQAVAPIAGAGQSGLQSDQVHVGAES